MNPPKIVLLLLIAVFVGLVLYSKIKNESDAYVTRSNDGSYTLKSNSKELKMAFEGPFSEDKSIKWEKTTLDFSDFKLELPIPSNWIVKQIDNDISFKNDVDCKAFSSQAYLIQSYDNLAQVTFNPTCNDPTDNLAMNSDNTLVQVSFEDNDTDDRPPAIRFYDQDDNVYRYGPSSGMTSGDKIMLVYCLVEQTHVGLSI